MTFQILPSVPKRLIMDDEELANCITFSLRLGEPNEITKSDDKAYQLPKKSMIHKGLYSSSLSDVYMDCNDIGNSQNNKYEKKRKENLRLDNKGVPGFPDFPDIWIGKTSFGNVRTKSNNNHKKNYNNKQTNMKQIVVATKAKSGKGRGYHRFKRTAVNKHGTLQSTVNKVKQSNRMMKRELKMRKKINKMAAVAKLETKRKNKIGMIDISKRLARLKCV